MTSARLVAVVGPTATGKSALAVRLATAAGGEVVNTDAMQLYRGMDIGTGKLSLDERRGVPHHLLDVLDVTQTATVAEFQEWARAAVTEVWSRGRLPVLVGGSGLYTQAVVDDLRFPGSDATVRARLEHELADQGPQALHQRLAQVDPEAAAAILPSNGRRLVRALEVVEVTGRPFVARLPQPRLWVDATLLVGLRLDRAALDARIERRVGDMWAAGLVEEVERLEAAGLRQGRTASRALGYQQVLAHLAGDCTQQEASERTVRATRRFARRQESWFRRDGRVRWLDADDPGLVEAALGLVRDLPSPP